jgi:isopentenyl-diphosphate delta-isomerase
MSILIPAWVDGKLTPVEKLDAHLRGLRHKAISVFVMNGGKLLIQKRAAGKYHTPGLWANTCCTHPDWDEGGLACAHRRLAEELGITGLNLIQRDTIEYRADVGGGMTEHEVVEVFVSEAPNVTWDLNPDEVEAVRWIDLYDLKAEIERHPGRFTAWLRIYMTEHMERIFGTLLRA